LYYSKAWELLERSYEVKRILVMRHLSLIVNLPALEKETTSGLTKLTDDVQQHLASLATMNVSVGPEMVVYLLESKLSKQTLNKWESSLEKGIDSVIQVRSLTFRTFISHEFVRAILQR
ncbi:hypothetical protein ALC62_08582, partial [Cyphomyrmex costatus]